MNILHVLVSSALQVMLVQEGASRGMVGMVQHIVREEGVKVTAVALRLGVARFQMNPNDIGDAMTMT